mgnify:CR=1 FL=1
MSGYASIKVQFRPYVLDLSRWNDGQWIAAMSRLNDDPGTPPIVIAQCGLRDPSASAHVSLDTSPPRLCVGGAQFAVPMKQLLRIRDWIDLQNAPVIATDTGAPE